ncbi:hypothetical protein CUZ56_01194 [Saezia sanguinis]|uniref:Uncharacterized protein n=1 Tax=Saezia sanguinis TaxID=1965230 RepID=A0A433SES8_9BURK|nr:hypothetical protein [Saezia sanguinis]RUS67251.1 hypothetical protein CUZ56_01194 [Saezia sanguinis]
MPSLDITEKGFLNDLEIFSWCEIAKRHAMLNQKAAMEELKQIYEDIEVDLKKRIHQSKSKFSIEKIVFDEKQYDEWITRPNKARDLKSYKLILDMIFNFIKQGDKNTLFEILSIDIQSLASEKNAQKILASYDLVASELSIPNANRLAPEKQKQLLLTGILGIQEFFKKIILATLDDCVNTVLDYQDQKVSKHQQQLYDHITAVTEDKVLQGIIQKTAANFNARLSAVRERLALYDDFLLSDLCRKSPVADIYLGYMKLISPRYRKSQNLTGNFGINTETSVCGKDEQLATRIHLSHLEEYGLCVPKVAFHYYDHYQYKVFEEKNDSLESSKMTNIQYDVNKAPTDKQHLRAHHIIYGEANKPSDKELPQYNLNAGLSFRQHALQYAYELLKAYPVKPPENLSKKKAGNSVFDTLEFNPLKDKLDYSLDHDKKILKGPTNIPTTLIGLIYWDMWYPKTKTTHEEIQGEIEKLTGDDPDKDPSSYVKNYHKINKKIISYSPECLPWSK